MAARPYCTFFLDEARFAVPAESVQEVLRDRELTSVPLAPPAVRGLLNLRGRIVVAVDLRRQLHLPERPPEAGAMHVVVGTAEGPVSLVVDRTGDVLELTEEGCLEPPETVRGRWRDLVRAVCPRDDGLLLVLDVERAASPVTAGEPAARR